jgi:SAM-dependent methyltransferase
VSWVVVALWTLLALIWGVDGLRLRRRARALATLGTDGGDPSGFRVVAAPGVTVPDATVAAAAAHARREGLEALDLVPADLPVWQLFLLLATCDPATYRRTRLAPGRSAGQAVLVSDALLARIPDPPADVFALAQRLKQYAPDAGDLAIAPGVRAAGADLATRRAMLGLLFGGITKVILLVQLVFFGLGLAGPLIAPIPGIVALALLHLQPLLATAGSALRPRDLLVYTLLRAPLDLVNIVRLALAPAPAEAERVEPLRPVYADLVAGGLGKFFEPRRDDCPLCGGRELETLLDTDDLLQNKPGDFHVDRCTSCKHVFQNPRLSIDGLNYYYRDFYDGLNEAKVEALFGFAPDPYLSRARAVGQVAKPRRWLDVGGGHGHFALVARDVLPEAQFDALDLSDSIAEAERRRWVGRGWRGLFPDLADQLAGEGYDVVSMSHYLEHTRDPRAEIAAAARVLAPGGHLMIEVPDPECRVRYLLGRYWIAWFQPQHQHWLSVANIGRVLAEEGFEPVLWQRGEAHIPADFRFAVYLLLERLSSAADLPWREAPTIQDRVMGQLVFWAGLPLMLGGVVLDRALAPLFRRPGWSNAYRVVARRVSS